MMLFTNILIFEGFRYRHIPGNGCWVHSNHVTCAMMQFFIIPPHILPLQQNIFFFSLTWHNFSANRAPIFTKKAHQCFVKMVLYHNRIFPLQIYCKLLRLKGPSAISFLLETIYHVYAKNVPVTAQRITLKTICPRYWDVIHHRKLSKILLLGVPKAPAVCFPLVGHDWRVDFCWEPSVHCHLGWKQYVT